jgi:hypothetical protein
MTDTARKLLAKPVTGSETNTWGTVLNANFDNIDKSVAGVTSKSLAAGDVTLSTDEARSPVQVLTGTLTANRNLIVPTSEAWYLVKNATTGNFTATVKTAAGSGLVIPRSSSYLVYCDGTDVVDGLMKVLLADFTVQSSDVGAGTGPRLIIDRNSASPAASDAIGEIQFLGRDSSGNSEKYAAVDAIILDPTSGSEDGRLRLRTVVASSLGTRFVIDNGLYSVNATGADKGADTINAKGYYLDGVALNTDPEATAAQYLANTADKTLTTDKLWAASGEVALTDAATISVDMSTFLNATVTLGGNRTLGQPSNTKVGQSGCIRIVQDGSGNRTLAYHADWKFAGGTDPALSTAAGAQDLLFYQVIAANIVFGDLVKAIA